MHPHEKATHPIIGKELGALIEIRVVPGPVSWPPSVVAVQVDAAVLMWGSDRACYCLISCCGAGAGRRLPTSKMPSYINRVIGR
jgi:hypothetical protein